MTRSYWRVGKETPLRHLGLSLGQQVHRELAAALFGAFARDAPECCRRRNGTCVCSSANPAGPWYSKANLWRCDSEGYRGHRSSMTTTPRSVSVLRNAAAATASFRVRLGCQ